MTREQFIAMCLIIMAGSGVGLVILQFVKALSGKVESGFPQESASNEQLRAPLMQSERKRL